MRIIIAGAGRGGLNLGVHLQRGGHNVSVVDRDPVVAQRAFELSGIVAHTGDATDVAVLKQAKEKGVEKPFLSGVKAKEWQRVMIIRRWRCCVRRSKARCCG